VRRERAQAPSPRAAAPIDLTGYWVSVVNEDWRWRMVTPPRGDYASVPMTAEARKVADGASPNGDEWFIVTTIVEDPRYLSQPFVTSSHFKKELDGSKWSPSPCRTAS
jgi:hypothetical protein